MELVEGNITTGVAHFPGGWGGGTGWVGGSRARLGLGPAVASTAGS